MERDVDAQQWTIRIEGQFIGSAADTLRRHGLVDPWGRTLGSDRYDRAPRRHWRSRGRKHGRTMTARERRAVYRRAEQLHRRAERRADPWRTLGRAFGIRR